MENQSESVVQLEPIPDNFDYYVVSKLKTLESNAKSLKHTEDEKLLLANKGDSILVQRISASKGLDEKRHMEIPTTKPTESKTKKTTFIDFCPLDNDKVITAKDNGMLEAYEFRLDKKKFRKIYELDMKRFSKNNKIEITAMDVSHPQNFLAVALAEKDPSLKNVLHSVVIFHLRTGTPLSMNNEEGLSYINPLYTHKFTQEKQNSAYNYLNFDYQHESLPLLIAAQMEGDRRLDAFVLENPEDDSATLKHRARKDSYHD